MPCSSRAATRSPACPASSQRGLPTVIWTPSTVTLDTAPGLLGHVRRGGSARSGGGDRRGQGVGAVLLRARPPSPVPGSRAIAFGGQHSGDSGLVAGQGAGLVDRDVADTAEAFEDRAGLDDHTELARRADRRDNGDRNRDRQRARRRSHQHDQRAGDPQLRDRPNSDPITATRAARIRTPGTSGRAIRSASRARSPFSACACSTSSTIVVSELSVPAAVASTSSAPAMLIAPAETAVAGLDLDGDRFTGDRGGVQAAPSGPHDPVCGDSLTGANEHHLRRQ